jgi:hypothetical protein
MFCYLPDWATTLIFFAGIAALAVSRHRLVERTEERVNRHRDEMEAWNQMSPTEQANVLIHNGDGHD